jgi:hypothetical protein
MSCTCWSCRFWVPQAKQVMGDALPYFAYEIDNILDNPALDTDTQMEQWTDLRLLTILRDHSGELIEGRVRVSN